MIREVVGENSGDLSSEDGPHRNSQTRWFPRPFFPGLTGLPIYLCTSLVNVIKIWWQSHTGSIIHHWHKDFSPKEIVSKLKVVWEDDLRCLSSRNFLGDDSIESETKRNVAWYIYIFLLQIFLEFLICTLNVVWSCSLVDIAIYFWSGIQQS